MLFVAIHALSLPDRDGHWLSNPKIYFLKLELVGFSRNWSEITRSKLLVLFPAAVPVLARSHPVCPPFGLVIARMLNVGWQCAVIVQAEESFCECDKVRPGLAGLDFVEG